MEEYLLTARSVTHAQRMMQVLAQNGYHAAMGRSPVGLTGSGCGYVLRLPVSRAPEAAVLLRSLGIGPLRVFQRQGSAYNEVEI